MANYLSIFEIPLSNTNNQFYEVNLGDAGWKFNYLNATKM